MAKISADQKNKKRIKMSFGLRRKTRDALRTLIKKDADGAFDGMLKLQKRKRDESPARVRNRCRSCGRPHGVLRKFGLCRICLRNAAMRGDVPGLRKASW